MAKILPNRVSKVISPEAHLALKAATDGFKVALGEPTPISDDDIKKLLRVAGTRKRVMDEILLIMEEHPTLIKAPFTLIEIKKDKSLMEILAEVESWLIGLLFSVRREMAVAGSEYFNAGAVFENDVKWEVGRNNPEARTAQAQLDAIDRKKGGNPGTPPPPAP